MAKSTRCDPGKRKRSNNRKVKNNTTQGWSTAYNKNNYKPKNIILLFITVTVELIWEQICT